MSSDTNTHGLGPSDAEPDIVWEVGRLVSDTRAGARIPGTRSGGQAERRMLFEGDGVYAELQFPADAGKAKDGAWLRGQFIVPEARAETYDLPMVAVLQNKQGVTGAKRMTEGGEFTLPFRGEGEYLLQFESHAGARGYGFRMTLVI